MTLVAASRIALSIVVGTLTQWVLFWLIPLLGSMLHLYDADYWQVLFVYFVACGLLAGILVVTILPSFLRNIQIASLSSIMSVLLLLCISGVQLKRLPGSSGEEYIMLLVLSVISLVSVPFGALACLFVSHRIA